MLPVCHRGVQGIGRGKTRGEVGVSEAPKVAEKPKWTPVPKENPFAARDRLMAAQSAIKFAAEMYPQDPIRARACASKVFDALIRVWKGDPMLVFSGWLSKIDTAPTESAIVDAFGRIP